MKIDLYTPVRSGEKYLPGKKASQNLTVDTFLDGVQEGRWEELVINYRAGRIPKIALPAATPSGTFSQRGASNLIEHSGFIVLDFDSKDNDAFPADEIAADPYVYAFHKSAGGQGYAVYIRIDGTKHKESFEALEKYFADNYYVILDPSGKDVSRMRYVSFDPECFRNPDAKLFKKLIEQKPAKKSEPKYFVYTENDVEHVINQIVYRNVNIADSYHDYIKIGFALATAYGEAGRAYFHKISSVSAKYNYEEAEKRYNNILKSGRRQVTIASLFYMAKQAGCEIKTARTHQIERVATVRALSVGKPGGYPDKESAKAAAKKMLAELDNIEGPDVDDVVEQVFQVPQENLKVESKHQVQELKEFLRDYNLRFNVVTMKAEYNGAPMTDRVMNTIYIKAVEQLATAKKNISKDFLATLIESDYLPEYNPIQAFFQERQHIRPKGKIDALLDSLLVADMRFSSDQHRIWSGQAYLDVYLRKWLLSCIASWHGTYSVMMAVLTGAQAAGKTNFFRRLLPDELRQYYADSKMDRASNDDLLLMCSKAIICDDEFSGKSKQDYKLLKELISKQTISIRRPYARFSEDYTRIAVLCGCSNEEEVINDPTGNRRIIPIPVVEIDWAKYNAVDKTELWMELYHEWQAIGDEWMLTKEEVKNLNEMTTKAQQVATEEEALWMFFQHPSEGGFVDWLSNTEIKNYIETNSRLHISSQKLGIYLAKNGFERRATRVGKSARYTWGVVKKSFFASNGGL